MSAITREPVKKVTRPVLVVGVGRSGTTLLYEILARHPDVGWFSNLTDRWPSVPQLAALSNLYRSSAIQRAGKWVPKPAEGYRLWANETPLDGPLDETDVTEDTVRRVNRAVRRHLRYQGKSRFLNKNTRNTRCMRYVDALFDDALFVHVLRDPRAVVASLLRVGFWPDLPIWCEDGVTPREWAAQGRDPAELAARLWAADVGKAREDGRAMPPHRYLEIHYEELVSEPVRVLRDLLDFARLDRDPSLTSYVQSLGLESRNEKFQDQLNEAQIRLVERAVGGGRV